MHRFPATKSPLHPRYADLIVSPSRSQAIAAVSNSVQYSPFVSPTHTSITNTNHIIQQQQQQQTPKQINSSLVTPIRNKNHSHST